MNDATGRHGPETPSGQGDADLDEKIKDARDEIVDQLTPTPPPFDEMHRAARGRVRRLSGAASLIVAAMVVFTIGVRDGDGGSSVIADDPSIEGTTTSMTTDARPDPERPPAEPQAGTSTAEDQDDVMPTTTTAGQGHDPVTSTTTTSAATTAAPPPVCQHSEVAFEIHTDHAVYEPGQTVESYSSVTNISDHDCQMPYSFGYEILHQEGTDGISVNSMASSGGVWSPGEALEVSFSWDQQSPDPSSGTSRQTSTGRYRLEVTWGGTAHDGSRMSYTTSTTFEVRS